MAEGADEVSMFFKKRSIDKALQALQSVSTLGVEIDNSKEIMLNTIEKVSQKHSNSDSSELNFQLGISWHNYCEWYVRGNQRLDYLQKAIHHFGKAYDLETAQKGSERIKYASHLGHVLVDEAKVRDLDRAIPLLEYVYNSLQAYTPDLCSYADALYKNGDYTESANVAMQLTKWAQQETPKGEIVPPAPLKIAAKAYRAQVKSLAKSEQYDKAIIASSKLLESGFATNNDERIHQKLLKDAAEKMGK